MTLWSPRKNLMAVLISRSHLLQRSHREISPSGSGKIKEQEHKWTFFFSFWELITTNKLAFESMLQETKKYKHSNLGMQCVTQKKPIAKVP